MLSLILLGLACRTYEIPNFEELTLDSTLSHHDISAEIPYNDMNQDGFTFNDGDCNDFDPSIYPESVEIWYDGIEQNCDGLSDYDKDGDGFWSENYLTSLSFGGGDCDDDDVLTHPSAEEIWYDGVD